MKKILPAAFALLLSTCFSQTAFAANVLLNDNFTASNGTELSHYNSGWKARFDEVKNSYIYSNEVVDLSNNSGYYFTPLSDLADICVSADFHSNWQNNSWISIGTRRQGDNDQLYLATIHQQVYYLGKDYSTVASGAIPNAPLDTNPHKVKFCSVGNVHSLYLDNVFINSFTDSSYSSGYVGFDTAANMIFDNLVISAPPEANISLNVPLFKQTNSSWKSNIYDYAKLWSPKDPTFGSWGCAVTSAAMVFNFKGIEKLPNGSRLDPGTLNDWLKSQKDGYVGNGLVNWLALTRLSKQAVFINNISNFDALEFTKIIPGTIDEIKDDLADEVPDILEEPGHFVVAKGTENGSVKINDPYYNRGSLSDYGNTLLSLNRFTPSHTNLSYILITYPVGLNLEVKDSNGIAVGQSFQQNPISNLNSLNQVNGEPLNFYYLQKPSVGYYYVNVLSPLNGSYDLGIYLYDKSGNVYQYDNFVPLKKNQAKTVQLSYDNSRDFYKIEVNFHELRSDLNVALRSRKIATDLYADLIVKEGIAEIQNKIGKKNDELKTLIDMQKNLDKSAGIKVFEPSYTALIYDLNYLESNL